jgi:oligopeptide transport system ATP-binding protein
MPNKEDYLTHMDDIMEVRELKMHFPVTKGLLKRQIGVIKAVDGVTFAVKRGQTLGIVGESGSGKSTVGNCLLARYRQTAGDVIFEGTNLNDIPKASMRKLRRSLQMITQDPFASLDPRFTVGECVGEGLRIHRMLNGKKALEEKTSAMLEMVGLSPDFAGRYPHEFSGGQRQRISIARALAMQPSFVVCDEVVSALDVSIQSQIIALLMRLQVELGLTYVFIGHDLSVVRHISHQVAVMYLGKLMELTGSDELYENPLHPYTEALISAVPIPDPKADRARKRILLSGELPSPLNPPDGCNFCTRCPYADERCREEEPDFKDVGGAHFVACHKAGRR